MFIKVRKRQNKQNETVYYFYKTENYRVDGKVKTKQEYIFNLSESEIFNIDRLMNRETYQLRKNDFKTWLLLITKIQFDILKENNKEGKI
ncbi:hypothetical protein GKZ28_13110 [Clostridium chromiireducens]|uniref:Uncharacterized protein n=1 Tax=Clostridium chromiireducens TaxID=225345 RepID=A0A964RMY7_9CLOT|nr:hypothetical protein [Clostridium chromiireducens]MVX64632.1 hypothetical protein [Clostridium chromiireducens]